MDKAASATAPRSSELPELPVLGNQRKWDVAKIVLRAISMAVAVIVICLVIAINFAGSRYTSVNASFGITVITVAWDTAEFIVICVRRDKSRGIKAEAHVGVDLVLWLLAVATLTVQAILVDSRNVNYNNYYYYNFRPNMPWYALDMTHLSLVGILIIIHFILFVRACVEVDRRKKDRRVQELILAMQQHGQNPQGLAAPNFAQSYLQSAASTLIASSSAHPTRSDPSVTTGAGGGGSNGGGTSNGEERDFSLKYNHAVAPVPELQESAQRLEMDAAGRATELPADSQYPDEMPVSPEDVRNQKVLIGSFTR
ncbi:hypothetical protein F5X99DRAFT_410771 [Biscogniauxia marginata]|nr:hypothetical protein F5X99DRAFT_410771 [Biscogniauxia marginata]